MCDPAATPEELADTFSLDELCLRRARCATNLRKTEDEMNTLIGAPASDERYVALSSRAFSIRADIARYERAILIKVTATREGPRGYVYVAGPMRGYPNFNFPAFKRAAADLRAEGYEVFSPAENDEKKGFDPTKGEGFSPTGETTPSLRSALADDTKWICETATHIYMLRGWEKSNGAKAEHALAVALGLTIMYEGGYYVPAE